MKIVNLRSVNGFPGFSADTPDLISVDFRSVRARLLDFLSKEPHIGHLSCGRRASMVAL